MAKVCPACMQVYPLTLAFCASDGAALVDPRNVNGSWARVAGTDPSATDEPPPILTGDFAEKVKQLWARHTLLASLTICALLAAILGGFTRGGGLMLIATGLGIPLLVSWPIALASSAKALSIVGWVDKWYFRLHDFFDGSNSRIMRWVMYPVVWAGGRWAVFASRRGDRFVAGSLRMFGYTLSAMMLAMLAIITVYIVIGLIVIAVGLWIVGQVLDVDSGPSPMRRMPMVGRRGQNIYQGGGGWLDPDKQIGRVDKDGNIYENDGSWFSVDKQVGKIGKNGEIYETDGGWFTPDKQVGKVGKNGEIYETDGGWFTPDKQVGRIGDEGEIYETDGGWFTPDKRVGKAKRD
ncbi:hypothetical protein [Novosphingobium aquae]|uniref:Uncharacterized protein n=1 Tax=Novosphingobium aquae TaxID=3133435 RepID=A0ABU8SC16_9SPHN